MSKKSLPAAPKPPVPLYIDTLDTLSGARYVDKLRQIGNKDPYQVKKSEWSPDVECYPDIIHDDIYTYCVHTVSAYTREEFRAYKSLDSFNYFMSGFVDLIGQIVVDGKHVLTAKVKHSQRMNDKCLQPWVVIEKDGVVLTGHCTCMAGLGETCSHIGAMLFAIASAVRIRESQTVTQKAAYWLLPPSIDKVGYHRIQDIDFTSAKTKKKQLDHAISILPATPEVRSRRKLPTVDEPTEDEMMALYQTLDKSDSMPVLLSLKPGFSKKYVPKVLSKKYPEVLSELQDENYVTALPETILKHCTTLFSEISVSEEEAKNVELATRLQSKCKAWFSFRTGRITASRMKSVCRTSVDKPAKSLIKDICYPSTTAFKSKYTEWGCDHEREATEQYKAKMCDIHENFTLLDSGLVLHPNYPFLGATPDGIAKCDCCGTVIVEIKCPYCKRNSKVDETVDCLEVRDGELRLSRKHGYYYQVQCQLLVTQQEYCDFIVWTQADYFQERIQIDMAFCNTLVDKSKDFFIKAVLPELVAKMYSRPMPALTSSIETSLAASDSINVQTTRPPLSALAVTSNVTTDSVRTSLPAPVSTNDDVQATRPPLPALAVTTTVTTDSVRTSLPAPVSTNDNIQTTRTVTDLICVCRTAYDDTKDTVGCDNLSCPYVWLHFACVGIKRAPRVDKWYCPQCRKLAEFRGSRTKVIRNPKLAKK